MNNSDTGNFRGKTYRTKQFGGITATETEYYYKFIDWHYHENPYFSLTTFGSCLEKNRRETFECLPDTLLFHNSQEPHFNRKSHLSRGFQVEINSAWRKKFEVDADKLPQSTKILSPNVKLLFYNIYKESKLSDDTSNLTIDSLLLQIFETMRGVEMISSFAKPVWAKKIDEILHDKFDQTLSLQYLSDELNIHWVHLSRDFPRYFRCNFSEYVRKIRVEKSLALLRQKNISLTEIALICGFADQSHFIRCFKAFNGITPKKFRQILS